MSADDGTVERGCLTAVLWLSTLGVRLALLWVGLVMLADAVPGMPRPEPWWLGAVYAMRIGFFGSTPTKRSGVVVGGATYRVEPESPTLPEVLGPALARVAVALLGLALLWAVLP